MRNRQLFAILFTILALAAMGFVLALVIWGGQTGENLLMEIGGMVATGIAALAALWRALPDEDGDGVPDVLQRSGRRRVAEEEDE